VALLVTAALVGSSVRAFVRAARLRREEAELLARLRALRAALGLDP